MPGSTTRFQLPYPLGTEPVADGDDSIKALAEKVDTVLYSGGTWANLVLGSAWGPQATYPTPQYRIAGGFCYLRGTARRTDGNIPTSSIIFACPVPGGGGTAVDSIVLDAVAFPSGGTGPWNLRVVVNPRADGNARCLAPASLAANLVALDGLIYPVT